MRKAGDSGFGKAMMDQVAENINNNSKDFVKKEMKGKTDELWKY